MSTLHILNKPPGHDRCRRCLSAMDAQDRLLLTEAAVLTLTRAHNLPPERTFALRADVDARGLPAEACNGVRLLNYDEMVTLTARSERIISW